MSLEILILAAEFLEWRSKTKTRGNDISTDFSIYEEQVKTSLNSDSIQSLSPLLSPPTPSPPPPPPPPLLLPSPPSASALQPLPEEPATSTSSSPSFLTPSTTPQSPQSSNSNNDLTFKNAEKNDKRRAGGAGTREVHNKLEKNRRAHMKEMFEYLRSQIPQLEDKKNSNLSILRNAIRYIQTLRRKEKEHEVEVQKLAQNKISLQEKLRRLKMDTSLMNIDCSIKDEPDTEDEEDIDTYSTSTASEGDGPIMSDVEEEKTRDAPKENHPQLKDIERKPLPINTCQALPTVIGAASPRLKFASTSTVMSTPTLLPGSIKPLKNISFLPSGATTLIANNTMSASNIIHNNNTHLTTNISTATQRPVMEILHKTLAQRQALNKQLFGNSTSNTQSEIISAKVNTVQSSQMFGTGTHLNAPNCIRSVIPLPPTSVKRSVQSTGIKLATLTIPVNKPTNMAITPHKKIMVETSPASISQGVSVTAAFSSSSSSSVTGTSTTLPSALTAIVRTPIAHPIVSQTLPVMSAVKQIITPAGNPLLGQSITRAQILNTSMISSQQMGSSSTATSSNQISSIHPVVSLTPVSQLVSPTLHVSPGLQQATQLNMFPIIQSQLFPTNQVVAQSVTAKPLVMVTVPTTTTVQVSVAMTPTTT